MVMPNVFQVFGLEITLIALIGYLWFQSLKNRKTVTLSAFFNLCTALLIFLIINIPVRISDLNIIRFSPDFVFLLNAIYISLETLTAYEWFIYFLTVQGIDLSDIKSKLLFAMPLIIMLILLGLSYKTHWLFYVNDSGMYARGSLFFLQLLLPYLYLIASFICAIIAYKKSHNKRMLLIFISAFSTTTVAAVLQILYSGSFNHAGLSLAVFLVYMEMYQFEIKEIENMRSLRTVNKQLEDVNGKLNETIKELEEALDMAESASRAKTTFLNNMSHDIRTPMNAILGFTNIAMNHINEPDKVNDSLKKIKLSGEHLLNLINDILEMSRIEAGKLEIVTSPLNAREVVDGVVTMGNFLAATKNITFNVKIDNLSNPYIYADELHTNQIIINLISNAIKYTNPGGIVDYSIEQLNDPVDGIVRYRVIVKDNGIGMSDEFQKHLFENFSREKSSTVSKQEGVGLGLAIVKRIIDLMGGTISVRSKLNEGSTFIVELPFEVMDEKAIEDFETSREKDIITTNEISFDGQRVLLVEDNEMNREIATDILEEIGLTIDTAEDGTIAVKKVKDKDASYYDFILMDIQMPIMNGYDATRLIREFNTEVPIFAMTANAFEEDKKFAFEAGMNEHLSKPIDVKMLKETISKYIK